MTRRQSGSNNEAEQTTDRTADSHKIIAEENVPSAGRWPEIEGDTGEGGAREDVNVHYVEQQILGASTGCHAKAVVRQTPHAELRLVQLPSGRSSMPRPKKVTARRIQGGQVGCPSGS